MSACTTVERCQRVFKSAAADLCLGGRWENYVRLDGRVKVCDAAFHRTAGEAAAVRTTPPGERVGCLLTANAKATAA